jgi:hypothetical protein
LFIVLKPDHSVTQNSLLKFSSSGVPTDYYYFSDTIYSSFGSTARNSHTPPYAGAGLNAAQVFNVTSVAGEYTARVDGTQVFTTATNTVGWGLAACLGGGDNPAAPTQFGTGLIAAVLIYDHKLSTNDRTTVMTGLRTKYGTA